MDLVIGRDSLSEKEPARATPEAVVFDIGEVLVRLDFSPIGHLLGLGPNVPLGEAISRFSQWDLYDSFERGHVDADAFYRQAVAPLGPNAPTYDQFVAVWNSVILDEVPGIGSLLERLSRRCSLYTLSNSNSLHIDSCLGRFDWFAHFRAVYSSHHLGLRKPEVEAYQRLAALTGHAPERILFLDDRHENILGARRAGWHGEHCQDPVADVGRILRRYGLVD